MELRADLTRLTLFETLRGGRPIKQFLLSLIFGVILHVVVNIIIISPPYRTSIRRTPSNGPFKTSIMAPSGTMIATFLWNPAAQSP